MHDFLAALALVLVLEGLAYAAAPAAVQRAMRRLAALAPGVLRGAGLAAALAGLTALWMVRG